MGAVLAVCITGLWVFENSTESRRAKLESNTEPNSKPVVVLELFTSQGCSSCPPADELLGRIRQEGKAGVYALSYHVDYWNYIGWEDPFSDSEYTDRQRDYNIKFGSRSNYTPQLVVNGREHFVGSDTRKVYQKISEYGGIPAENQIVISQIKSEGGKIQFNYDVSGSITDKSLKVLVLIDERTTSVGRGENRNRKLTNYNIVVESKGIDLNSKSGKSIIDIPDLVRDSDKLRLIVLVENGDSEITGAGSSGLIRL